MERFYSIAGITWRIIIPEGWSYHDGGVLKEYLTDGTSWDRTLEIEIVDGLPAPEGGLVFADTGKLVYISGDVNLRYEGIVASGPGGAYQCIRRQGAHSLLQVERSAVRDRITQKMILNGIEAEHQVVQNGGFLLHASYIRCDDGAILFTAPSGTGKSTQAELWCRFRGAELINGDRAVVCMDAATEVPLACGVPYAGSSGVCKNQVMPLKAIVRLSQAPVTKIEKLTGIRAFRHVWEGCCVNTWNRDDMDRCMQTVMDTVQRIPVFHLACTPDESAVIALEEALKKLR